MNLIFALCATMCIASGSAWHYGPFTSTIDIGRTNDPSPEDVTASNNLIGLLEYVRRLMPVGISNIVPPMEPYVRLNLPPADFQDPDSKLHGSVKLSNLVASGAQGFTINDIDVQINSERVDFNITVPQVIADLDYLAINFEYSKHFVFNVSGHVQIIIDNLNVVGSLSTGVLVVSPDSLESYPYVVTGLYVANNGDDIQTDVDASMIPLEILQEIKDVLFTSVAETAIEEMDLILSHFSTNQVLEFLEGDGSILDIENK